MLSTSCGICEAETSKYRCPSCHISYCSINCWNSHKKQPCEKRENTVTEPESTLNYYAFRTEDTVPLEKLQLLEHHEGVRDTLSNPHVRSILNVIDKSKNPSLALKVAMLEPIFVEFVEECLKIVEPQELDQFDL